MRRLKVRYRPEAVADLEDIFADQEPLTHPLTLREAFGRALRYNLDARVKAMEQALALDDLDLSKVDLLPKAAVNASYVARSNVDASSSRSVAARLTRRMPLMPSGSAYQTAGPSRPVSVPDPRPLLHHSRLRRRDERPNCCGS